jgi:phosphoglycerate dehydrogenase-like enzyme
MGRIGSATARRLSCLGVEILYYDILQKMDLEEEIGIKFCSLDEILEICDIITIHIPSTARTRHLIGSEEFKKMKEGVYIINTARGAIIDTDALIEALTDGKVAGAALDVFEEEPLNPEHPLAYMDNVILTPHISASSKAAIRRMAFQVAEGVIKIFNGEEPLNRVL